jgi:hypothetical protein
MHSWLDMRITSLFSIEIKWWLPKMETRRPEMRDGTSGFCELSLKCAGFSCGVVTYVIVPITSVHATNRCYGYVKFMHLTSKMGRQKFLDVGCYLMWPHINVQVVMHVDKIRRAFGPWSVSWMWLECSRKRKAWFSADHIYHTKSAVRVELR